MTRTSPRWGTTDSKEAPVPAYLGMPLNAADQPADAPLTDRYGRVARDLRVSLTDRCNLRCTYCMPEDPASWLPDEVLLSDEELLRLVRIAITRLAITNVRFTGGEPLLRRSLEHLVAATAAMTTHDGKRPGISMTTNALGLAHRAQALADAGMQRVNVSLDTTNPDHYADVTQRNRLPAVLAGLAAARKAGLTPIKVNAVPQPETYRTDASQLLHFCLTHGYQLRFIEHMPLGADSATWQANTIVTRRQLLEALTSTGAILTEPAVSRGTAPAELWNVEWDGLSGDVGIIASVTAPFCATCDRTRITADGQLRTCLFDNAETDLRTPMRAGASDDEIAELWKRATWVKPRAHGIDHDGFARPARPMSAIGG